MSSFMLALLWGCIALTCTVMGVPIAAQVICWGMFYMYSFVHTIYAENDYRIRRSIIRGIAARRHKQDQEQ